VVRSIAKLSEGTCYKNDLMAGLSMFDWPVPADRVRLRWRRAPATTPLQLLARSRLSCPMGGQSAPILNPSPARSMITLDVRVLLSETVGARVDAYSEASTAQGLADPNFRSAQSGQSTSASHRSANRTYQGRALPRRGSHSAHIRSSAIVSGTGPVHTH
jgi:hypothetical protein